MAKILSYEPNRDIKDLKRERQILHAVSFKSSHGCLKAVKGLRENGFHIVDVHSPFPVHGMDEAMGMRPTRLGWATFFGGIGGLSIAMGFQAWTHTVDWPLNIGGKSNLAWEALIPVAFELTILLAAFATVGGLLFKGKLFPPKGVGMPKTQPNAFVTDDEFVVLVSEFDAGFDSEEFHRICMDHGATTFDDAWRLTQ